MPGRRSRAGSSSNLDRFLEQTTPVLPAQYFSSKSMKTHWDRDNEFRSYFILGDLWDSFREWSAYGAGVPLTMNGSDSVVQYYYPSLSAIQLHIDPSRRLMEQGTRFRHNSRGPSGRNTPLNNSSVDWDGISHPCEQLIFQYCEGKIPYERETLVDQMAILASGFPELRTYRSCDLTDSSWISVAWYPIYRIPVGETLPVAQTIQNAKAHFLAFHSLAKPRTSNDGQSKLTLPTFGLVTKQFEVSEWDKNVYVSHKISSLLREAENWLRPLQLNCCDRSYFLKPHDTNRR